MNKEASAYLFGVYIEVDILKVAPNVRHQVINFIKARIKRWAG